MKYFILNFVGLLVCLATIFFFEARRETYDFYRSELLKRLLNNFNFLVSKKYENEYKANVEKISKLERIEYNDLADFSINIEKMTEVIRQNINESQNSSGQNNDAR